MSGNAASADAAGDRIDVRSWVLTRMNRWALAGAILVAVYVTLVSASFLGFTPLREIATGQDPIETLFAAFIGAIITGTAIVVTINQLVLSQELGAVGDQYDRMRDAMSFQHDLEEVLGEDVMSPAPAAFLSDVLGGIERRVGDLEEAVADGAAEEFQRDVADYSEGLRTDVRAVRAPLADAQFGTFAVIEIALRFNYSWWIYRARRIRADHAEAIGGETDAALEDVIESLTLFGPSREHFKTLYFQWALIDLSRALLYVAIPALVVVAAFVMFVDGSTTPGRTLGVDNLVWLTSFGVTVGVAPFVVFTVYILRIATVAKRTLAMGPTILRADKRGEDTSSDDADRTGLSASDSQPDRNGR